MLQKINIFQNLSEFFLKKINGFPKIFSSTTEFNIDISNKCFLNSKFAY